MSSIFADIVLEDLENTCLQKLDFKPTFYLRYVDDVITCIPASKLNVMLNIFNTYHPRLQFTYEVENNKTINFLDVQLLRKNNKIIYNWYRKPTFSARFLNFHSNHTKYQKVGMIYTLVDKAILLSDSSFHANNLDLVKNFLIENGYPEKFIDFYIKKRLDNMHFRQTNDVISYDKNKKIIAKRPKICIPYIKGFYESIRKIFGKYNIITLPIICNNLNNVVIKGKDILKKENKTKAVYKLECNNCTASYVGMSTREALDRIDEHRRPVDSINKKKFAVLNKRLPT